MIGKDKVSGRDYGDWIGCELFTRLHRFEPFLEPFVPSIYIYLWSGGRWQGGTVLIGVLARSGPQHTNAGELIHHGLNVSARFFRQGQGDESDQVFRLDQRRSDGMKCGLSILLLK